MVVLVNVNVSVSGTIERKQKIGNYYIFIQLIVFHAYFSPSATTLGTVSCNFYYSA